VDTAATVVSATGISINYLLSSGLSDEGLFEDMLVPQYTPPSPGLQQCTTTQTAFNHT